MKDIYKINYNDFNKNIQLCDSNYNLNKNNTQIGGATYEFYNLINIKYFKYLYDIFSDLINVKSSVDNSSLVKPSDVHIINEDIGKDLYHPITILMGLDELSLNNKLVSDISYQKLEEDFNNIDIDNTTKLKQLAEKIQKESYSRLFVSTDVLRMNKYRDANDAFYKLIIFLNIARLSDILNIKKYIDYNFCEQFIWNSSILLNIFKVHIKGKEDLNLLFISPGNNFTISKFFSNRKIDESGRGDDSQDNNMEKICKVTGSYIFHRIESVEIFKKLQDNIISIEIVTPEILLDKNIPDNSYQDKVSDENKFPEKKFPETNKFIKITYSDSKKSKCIIIKYDSYENIQSSNIQSSNIQPQIKISNNDNQIEIIFNNIKYIINKFKDYTTYNFYYNFYSVYGFETPVTEMVWLVKYIETISYEYKTSDVIVINNQSNNYAKESIEEEAIINNIKYKLFAVNSHNGVHYNSNIKLNDEKWYIFDDLDNEIKEIKTANKHINNNKVDEDGNEEVNSLKNTILIYKKEDVNVNKKNIIFNWYDNSCYFHSIIHILLKLEPFTNLFTDESMYEDHLNQIYNLIDIENELLSFGKLTTDSVAYNQSENIKQKIYTIDYLKRSDMRSNIDTVIFKFNNLYDKIKFIFDYVRDSNIFYKINSCNKEIQIKFLEIITNIKNKLIDLLAIYNDLSFIYKIEDKDVFYQILDLLVFINDYILKKN